MRRHLCCCYSRLTLWSFLQGAAVTELIETLLARVDIQGHLERTEPDYPSKWQNVLEMVSIAHSSVALQQSLLEADPLHRSPTANLRRIDRAQPRGCSRQGAGGPRSGRSR